MQKFDAIIVGAGHAGIEAARALAMSKFKIAVVTLDLKKVGALSCNPAIGGVAKSHLVHEIDALGGLMGHCADKVSIQSRRLNMRKGPAVRATRVQCDKDLYSIEVSKLLQQHTNITFIQDECSSFQTKNNKLTKIIFKSGLELETRALLITAGTFMRGLMFIGKEQSVGGRFGDKAADSLSESIIDSGHSLTRLKTGTPARLDTNTINYEILNEQWGDEKRKHFSWRAFENNLKQICCHITYTNERTHDYIKKHIKESALYGGDIVGVGPRYCPSVEDKVLKFPDKSRHQIFLEPEGLNTDFVYPNGMSTSLPVEHQINFLRTIEGLEKVELKRPGYAVEYDTIDPTTLEYSLMSQSTEGLFFAGQVNRSSGYEEAAAQGLWAGLQCLQFLSNKAMIYPDLTRGYIDTLIYDLTTKGSDEPYRLFTSRSEYRLHLRSDNAFERYFDLGKSLDLIDSDQINYFEQQVEEYKTVKNNASQHKIRLSQDKVITLLDFLKRPEVTWQSAMDQFDSSIYSQSVLEKLEVDVKYAGYLKRQEVDIRQLRKNDSLSIASGVDKIQGLSIEVKEKLIKYQPKTIAELKLISGITPAAIIQIIRFSKKNHVSRETIS